MSPRASSAEPSDSRPSRVNLDEIAQVLAAQSTQPQPQPPNRPEEQALESHEVIELQTFSERKAWIEEKIKVGSSFPSSGSLFIHFTKFLESLPPIEVFSGLEAVKASSLDVPGLPTREELQRWAAEHDTIEKETEMFDTGELKKLRQLTKGTSTTPSRRTLCKFSHSGDTAESVSGRHGRDRTHIDHHLRPRQTATSSPQSF